MIQTGNVGEHSVFYGKRKVCFQLQFSERKTLGITVRPDLSVLVTAPKEASIDKIKTLVQKRVRWIRKQQSFFEPYLPPLPPRQYVSGETHRFLGRQYRLKVIETSDEFVKLKGRFFHVHARERSDSRRIKALLGAWYERRAREAFERSFAECRSKLNGHLPIEPTLRLRRMPKRWGSCTKAGTIYLNPDLVKASRTCIDYVVTHELCHLVHPNHAKDFYVLLCKLMPDWEDRKARLERTLLD